MRLVALDRSSPRIYPLRITSIVFLSYTPAMHLWRYKHFSRFVASTALGLCVTACGLKGPLYLPDNGRGEVVEEAREPQDEPEPQATPIPQQRKKRATDKTPASDTQTPVSPPGPDRPASSATEEPGP